MKKLLVKIILLGTLFLLAQKWSVAAGPACFADTGRKAILASVNKDDAGNTVRKGSNVVFPEILAGNEEHSLDYIESFSAARRGYLMRTFARSKKFFPKAAAILKKHNIPEEFKVLLALESGFNADARSKAGAVGYWQLMDNVAKEYGLKIAEETKTVTRKKRKLLIARKFSGTDERKNFNKSTYVAARYLRDRSRNLNNDWLLMVASYNCGVGNVWEAMKKTGKQAPTFWDIKNYLPAETQYYVMNFIALNVIFKNYEKFAGNTLQFKSIQVKTQTLDCDLCDPDPNSTAFIE